MYDLDELESKVSDEYDGCTRVLYRLECNYCDKDYWRPAKNLENSKCCCRDCYTNWRAKTGKRLIFNCTLCNKEFKRFKHHAANVESSRLFCSRNCQTIFFTKEKSNCLNCNKELATHDGKFCPVDCQREFNYKENIRAWKDGTLSGMNEGEGMSTWLRRYIFEKYDSKCCECGWAKVHMITGKIPLQVDHIDGNHQNNVEENLRLLCPNCHSLTATYGNLNMGNGRKKRKEKIREYNKKVKEIENLCIT